MMRPLENHVIVEKTKAKEVTESGIIIPDKAREKMQSGIVLAVGRGLSLPDGEIRPMEVKVGDTILFGKYAGYELQIEGKDVTIMDSDDISAVIE